MEHIKIDMLNIDGVHLTWGFNMVDGPSLYKRQYVTLRRLCQSSSEIIMTRWWANTQGAYRMLTVNRFWLVFHKDVIIHVFQCVVCQQDKHCN